MELTLEERNRCFRVLELRPNASLQDIRNSYQRLKDLYASDNIAVSAIAEDFPPEYKKEILDQIDEAYNNLIGFYKDKEKEIEIKEKKERERNILAYDDELREYVANVQSFSGEVLKKIREKLKVDLAEIANFTKIRKQYFDDIEHEKFVSFTSEVYLRGYVIAYAHYLILDPVKVANDYVARYRAWKTSNGNGSSNSSNY